VRAVEHALNITIPDNARILRNIINAIQAIHDHVIHFYHLHALDWVDVVSALKADPAKTAALASSISDWPNNASASYFKAVAGKLKAFVESGQLGIFANGYWGHPAYKLPPEANLMAVAHYLEALDWQRDFIKAMALLGAKNPHPQTYLVGGMATPIDPNSQNAINANTIAQLLEYADRAQAFVDKVYIPDLLAIASFYKDWAGIGAGVGNFLSYGEFQNDNLPNTTNVWLPAGFIKGKDLTKIEKVDHKKMTEEVSRSWYKYAGGDDKPLHPWDGETTPNYTGPKETYKELNTDGKNKYSWVKAIRYDGVPVEVGPLARMVIAYAAGHKEAKGLIDFVLGKLGVGPAALFSTLGRTAARGIETKLIADKLPSYIMELAANIKKGDYRVANTDKWEPSTWPAEAKGYGYHEAPRGALCHWIVIKDRQIANYQCVVPGGVNASPRDAKGQRGPDEEALIGTPIAKPDQPLEIIRTIHSFDPCMACAIHAVDANGKEIVQVRVR
jgi:[NiFe] hydrogenase large subunit/hydrogenase large subunit